MGKKPIVSVTYENERISIKNRLPYLKCLLRLSCVVHGPIYGRFIFFLCKRFSRCKPLPLRNNVDAHISSLGYLCVHRVILSVFPCK